MSIRLTGALALAEDARLAPQWKGIVGSGRGPFGAQSPSFMLRGLSYG